MTRHSTLDASRDLPRRPGPSTRIRVTEHRGDRQAPRTGEDRVVTEEPLEIRLGGPGTAPSTAWVTMRTPGHDFELALGWAVHEGRLAPGAVDTVAYCTDVALAPEQAFNVVTVTSRTPLAPAPARHLEHLSSGSSACGVCGAQSVAAAVRVSASRRWAGEVPSHAVLMTLPDRLRARQPLFDRTGGSHAAALFDEQGELLVVREDVGRHNAVDKITGARVLAGHSPATAGVVVSGRASFELVQKAVAAGVGTLVAVGAPTSLAVRLAGDAGLALHGFARPDRLVRYA